MTTTRRTAFRITALIGALTAIALGASACASGGTGSEPSANANEPESVETLIVATGASPRPYTFLDESDSLTGYDIEVLRAVDALLPEYAFDFQVAEFPALFAGLDSGRFNIVANNLSATEQRREKYEFSDPTIQAHFGIITKQDDAGGIATLDDLAGKKTYGEAGLNFTKILEAYNDANPDRAIQIDYTELDLQTQYNNLATGSTDFLFNERVVFNGYGAKPELGLTFTELDGEYLTKTYGTSLYSAYALSRQTPNVDRVLARINEALAQLREEGTLLELSERFFDGADVTPQTD